MGMPHFFFFFFCLFVKGNSFCDFLYAFRSHPIALRKAKIVYNFGLSECNGINLALPETGPFFKGKIEEEIFTF